FMILIDYGHEARELYSVTHATGTLTTFRAHRATGAETTTPAWLQDPGAQDITSHVDFTSVRAAAEAAGMDTIPFLDQPYFLRGLGAGWDAERLAARARPQDADDAGRARKHDEAPDWRQGRRQPRAHGVRGRRARDVMGIGLAIMIVTQTATLFGIEPFASWNTPIAWTGFILFADGFVFASRGNSWLRSAPREFAWLALASIPFWVLFEGYNLIIHNWYYTGLPESFWLRQFGYAWSFATIWPAIFEGADLIAVLRSGSSTSSPQWNGIGTSAWWVIAGASMLIVPFVVSPDIARYLAAPIWLGFI